MIGWAAPLTPRGFLIWSGVALVVLGLLGYFVLRDPAQTVFWLDDTENLVHTVLGLVALAVVYLPGLDTALGSRLRSIVLVVGLVALFLGVYGFLVPPGGPAAPNAFGLANLELGDNVLNLALAGWAFAVYLTSEQRSPTRP